MVETSGEMLRDARLRAGLTQSRLAQLAGVAQPMISAYENDRREPTFSTLDKLLAATGHTLAVRELEPHERHEATSTLQVIRRKRRQIVSLLEHGGARHPRVFGSVARGDDAIDSDIDVLVDLDPDVSVVRLIGLERQLSELLGRPVDLVPADALKPSVRTRALAESVAL